MLITEFINESNSFCLLGCKVYKEPYQRIDLEKYEVVKTPSKEGWKGVGNSLSKTRMFKWFPEEMINEKPYQVTSIGLDKKPCSKRDEENLESFLKGSSQLSFNNNHKYFLTIKARYNLDQLSPKVMPGFIFTGKHIFVFGSSTVGYLFLSQFLEPSVRLGWLWMTTPNLTTHITIQ